MEIGLPRFFTIFGLNSMKPNLRRTPFFNRARTFNTGLAPCGLWRCGCFGLASQIKAFTALIEIPTPTLPHDRQARPRCTQLFYPSPKISDFLNLGHWSARTEIRLAATKMVRCGGNDDKEWTSKSFGEAVESSLSVGQADKLFGEVSRQKFNNPLVST